MPAPTLPVEVPAVDLQRDPDGLLVKETDTSLVLGIPPEQEGRGCLMWVPLLGSLLFGGMTVAGFFVGPPLAALLIGSLSGTLALVFGTLARRAWRSSHQWDWVSVTDGLVTLVLPDETETAGEELLGRGWGPGFNEHVHHHTDDFGRTSKYSTFDLVLQSDAGERKIMSAAGKHERRIRRVYDLLVAHLPADKPEGDAPPLPSPPPDAPLERDGW